MSTMTPPRKVRRPRTLAPRDVNDPWMTVPEAARALGIHDQTVKARIAANLLVAQVVAGRLFVRRDTVQALAAQGA
jgi:excisionase family DNA binding protein